jgi:hypothetical protein
MGWATFLGFFHKIKTGNSVFKLSLTSGLALAVLCSGMVSALGTEDRGFESSQKLGNNQCNAVVL